jgi:hypothetical protein
MEEPQLGAANRVPGGLLPRHQKEQNRRAAAAWASVFGGQC